MGCTPVKINFVPVPAGCLPVGVIVAVTEGDQDVVYLVNESASLPQICASLTEVTTAYAATAWVHVGVPGEFADAV